MAIALRGGKGCQEYTLLDAADATCDGEWVDVRGWRRLTVHVDGLGGGDEAKICGSCEPTKPDNDDHGIQIGDSITGDTIYEISAKLKYVKVYVSALGTGPIYAYAVGDELKGGI